MIHSFSVFNSIKRDAFRGVVLPHCKVCIRSKKVLVYAGEGSVSTACVRGITAGSVYRDTLSRTSTWKLGASATPSSAAGCGRTCVKP